MSEPDVLTYLASIEQKLAEMLPILRDRLPRGGSRADGPVLSGEMTCRECGGTGTVPLTERVFPSGASEEPAPGGGEPPIFHECPKCGTATIGETIRRHKKALAAKDEELRKLRDDVARQDAEALNSGFVAGAASRDAEVARLTRQSIAAQKDRDYYQSRCAQVEEAHAALREQVAAADEALAACRAEAGGRIEALERERDLAKAGCEEANRMIARQVQDVNAAWDEARRMREALEAFPVSPPRGTAGFSPGAGSAIRDWFHDHHKPALDALLPEGGEW